MASDPFSLVNLYSLSFTIVQRLDLLQSETSKEHTKPWCNMVRVETILHTKLILAEPIQKISDEIIWRLVFYDKVTGEEHEITVAMDIDELGE